MPNDHVVYRAAVVAGGVVPPDPSGYEFEVWSPTLSRIAPSSTPRTPYVAWWLFDRCHVFRNRDYSVVLGWHRGEVVHRTGVFPGYFRFPFMAHDDLQLGDVWTSPAHRGRGLAVHGLRVAMTTLTQRRDRLFWYLSLETNTASIRAAERVGLVFHAHATRTRRLGLRALGAFELSKPP